jgi:hypothetical protein
MKPSLVAALGARAVLPAFGLRFRNRRDMNAGRAGRAAVEGHVVSTPSGKALRFAAMRQFDH